ncbi:MAG: tetratricopeptide repeat protein, partial [Cyanobacteriota bacterium]
MSNFIKIILVFVLILSIKMPVCAHYGKYEKEMQMAEGLLNQSREDAAIAVYNALIMKSPNYYPAQLALATVYARQAKYVQAEKIILKVLNNNKKDANAYERLAYLYYLWADANKESATHFLKKGLEAIKKAIELDKYNEQIYNTYGLILIEYKEYQDALKSFNKAIDINPSSQEAFTNLGVLYTRLEKYDIALSNFQRAIHIKTSYSRPYRELSIMLAQTNQERQAIEYLEKARFHDIFITYQDHYLMATLQEKMGNLKQAINEFLDVLIQKPDYIDCYTHIARLAEALGDDKMSV